MFDSIINAEACNFLLNKYKILLIINYKKIKLIKLVNIFVELYLYKVYKLFFTLNIYKKNVKLEIFFLLNIFILPVRFQLKFIYLYI